MGSEAKPGDAAQERAREDLDQLVTSAREKQAAFLAGLPPDDSGEWDDTSAIVVNVHNAPPAPQNSDSTPPPPIVGWMVIPARTVLSLFDKRVRGTVALILLVAVLVEWFRPGSVLQEWARPERIQHNADTELMGDVPALREDAP